MRLAFPFIAISMVLTAAGEESARHRFDSAGSYRPAGFPERPPKILALAEKPVTLCFSGMPADWQPGVRIHRVTATRRIELPSAGPFAAEGVWQLAWTPPETRGPARYEVRFEGDPARVVLIETRPPEWIEAIRAALANAEWEARGLTSGESSALAVLGIRTEPGKAAGPFLEMRPRQSGAARRRVVWDEKNPALLVWRPGPSGGDLEARAPRWWISPESLATDQGRIRLLDLFSEPPPSP